MYAVFYDTQMNVIDEIDVGFVTSYDKKCIEYAGSRINNISSLFIICEDEERESVSQESLIAFYTPLIIRSLADQNEKVIKEGFFSESLQATFSFDAKDQDNISQELTLMTAGLAESLHEWNTKDKGVIFMDDDQFRTFCVEAGAHKRFHMSRYWRIKEKLQNCTSLETLKQIDDIETAESILDQYAGG